MRCPACVAEGKTSRLHMTVAPTAPRPVDRFWDEDGKMHVHDFTIRRSGFRCSNGHNYEQVFQSSCPRRECEWNGARAGQGRAEGVGT